MMDKDNWNKALRHSLIRYTIGTSHMVNAWSSHLWRKRTYELYLQLKDELGGLVRPQQGPSLPIIGCSDAEVAARVSDAVSSVCGIPGGEWRHGRKRECVEAREMAVALMRRCGLSLSRTAMRMGYNHATISHLHKVFAMDYETDEIFRLKVDKAKELLGLND